MKTLFLLLMLGCASTLTFAAPACCSTNIPSAEPLSDQSIYNLASTWISDYGKEIQLEKFRGQPRLVTMFFASCEYACPILVYDLQRIDEALTASGVTNASFVLVTFDSDRDTVEHLHGFRQTRKLDDRWALLRGDPGDVLELAALLGIKYKKDVRGQFAHSNVILLLDAEGQIVHRQIGLNQDPAATAAKFKELTRP